MSMAEPVRKSQRLHRKYETESAKKRGKADKKRAYDQARVYVGTHKQLWNEIKQKLSLKSDPEMAELLLKR
jgi:hypothetical protein